MNLKRNEQITWNFPSNNYGQIYGISDSGVETFKGTPIKSLAREICQNSIDANLREGFPTRVQFKTFEVDANEIPGFKDLRDTFDRAKEYWDLQKSSKAKMFFETAISAAEKPKIKCLRISDYNTTGLLGATDEYNSHWSNLTKSQGSSDKCGSNGGSFGIGKFAPYACSYFRTIFYSTLDSSGNEAHQGVARLTSFKDEGGDTKQGTGFYGKDRNLPILKQFSLDKNYSRGKDASGTDIFITGFASDVDWKIKMIASILDGFLYAVYLGELIVEVEDIIIRRENLPALIKQYKTDFEEYADEYYETLIAEERVSPKYSKTIDSMGKISLRLMIKPEYHRSVAMVRQTGMKIMDKRSISGLIPFAGILYIEGEELNECLRNLENPQHTKWELERAENKSDAKRILNGLIKFIKECLNELKNDDSEEVLDPSVGEYLAADDMEHNKQENIKENINDIITDFHVNKVERGTKMKGPVDNDSATEITDPYIDPNVEDKAGNSRHSKENGGGEGSCDCEKNDGDRSWKDSSEHRKRLVDIPGAKNRVFCKNKADGEYRVLFVPSISAKDGFLELFLSAESQNYNADIVSVYSKDNPDASFSKNLIKNITFVENIQIEIDVKINYYDYCSMEVKAYGNKI